MSALTELYKLYAVTTPSGMIDGITNVQTQMNDEEMVVATDGQVDPTFVAMAQQLAVVSFTSVKLANSLGTIGLNGEAIAAETTLFWQKMAQGGTRAGATSHIKVAASAGIIVPRSISASQGSPAEISYDFALRSADGLTAPLSATASQSLTGSPDADEVFTVGPFKYNTTLDEGVTDITLDFGVELAQLVAGGHTYPTFVGIDRRRPRITVQTKNIPFATATIGYAGVAIASGTLGKLWFRKKAEGGTNVAAATTEHVLLTINEGRARLVSDEAQHDSTGTATIEITPTFDGSNDIVAVTTGAAIA